ncbi:hypothetical protein BDV29DRAFT_174009, partial [Aspergillus leporis]
MMTERRSGKQFTAQGMGMGQLMEVCLICFALLFAMTMAVPLASDQTSDHSVPVRKKSSSRMSVLLLF